MIKKFNDGSYIELRKADNSPGEVILSLCSIDPNNSKIVSVTSVSIKLEELKSLIDEIDKWEVLF